MSSPTALSPKAWALSTRARIIRQGERHGQVETDNRPRNPIAFHAFKPNPDSLVKEKVESDFVAITQNSDYRNDPRWNDLTQRDAFIKDAELKFLRPYQLRAIAALQIAVRNGQTCFLFEMATGTGKTLTATAVIKLFMRTGNAKRVLFLVDRIELENQAWKAFVRCLKNDFRTVIYKENRRLAQGRDRGHHRSELAVQQQVPAAVFADGL